MLNSFQSLDLANERFVLENCDDTNINTLASKIPTDKGRFHVFTYKHTHEGDYMESIGKKQTPFCYMKYGVAWSHC